jgi:arylsulfatase B
LPTLGKLAGAKFKYTQKLDGIDLASMVANGTSGLRKEVVVIDDVFGVSSLIENRYKFVNGTLLDGYADSWLGSNVHHDANSDSYVKNVLNSKAAKALKKFGKLDSTTVATLRAGAKVECGGVKTECNLMKAPCLFDIMKDPCEENNLASTHPKEMKSIRKTFDKRLKNVVPSRFQESGKRK